MIKKVDVKISKETGGAYADVRQVIESELERIEHVRLNRQTEPVRIIAERTAREHASRLNGMQLLALADAIEAALRDRDERAAKIAEAMRPSGGRMWTGEQSACFDALSDCAVAIRRGVTNAN